MNKELKITIPDKLGDITLEQYKMFAKMAEGIGDEDKLTEIIVTIFCNITPQQLRLLRDTQVQDIISRLQPLLEQFGSNVPLINRFTLDGVEYGFIPNINNISYGENKDITSFMSEGIDGMHKAMGVLFRPIIKTYNDTYLIEEYDGSEKYSEVMKGMPLSVMLGAQVFFWTLIKELLAHIPSYLESQMEKEDYQLLMQKVSTNITGDPMMKSFASLKETLEGLMK